MYRLASFWYESSALAANPLGDPALRQTLVLTPEEYGDEVRLPSIWMLASFLSTGAAFLAFRPWQETLWDRINRLSRSGALPPARFVLPDVFTAVGGSQFIDSPAIGAYQSYLWDELLPQFESRYASGRRGLVGTSSGGYGAIVNALLRPALFSAIAAHAADMGFAWCYLPDFPKLLEVLRRYGGLEAFWEVFRTTPVKPKEWISAINFLAMSLAYSPNMEAPPPHADLPLDPATLELRSDVWQRWLAWDPVSLIDRAEIQECARGLDLLYFDVGVNDQYQLQYGAEVFHRKLRGFHIPHHFETFVGDHFGTQARFERSLPWLARVLSD